MVEYVIVKYRFQKQICKTEPSIIGVFNSFEIAEEKRKTLHIEAWSQIIKEGILNDTFDHYAENIKSQGFNFNPDASQEEIQKFVEFIEVGEVEDPYVGKTNLDPIKILEIQQVPTVIENNATDRYIIKEDFLDHTGEIYIKTEHNASGPPVFITDQLETAKTKLQDLEYHYFMNKVLGGFNARMSLQTSAYWQDVVFLQEATLDLIESKLTQMNISLDRPNGINDVQQIRAILAEVVGVGLIDNFYSIKSFAINTLS